MRNVTLFEFIPDLLTRGVGFFPSQRIRTLAAWKTGKKQNWIPVFWGARLRFLSLLKWENLFSSVWKTLRIFSIASILDQSPIQADKIELVWRHWCLLNFVPESLQHSLPCRGSPVFFRND